MKHDNATEEIQEVAALYALGALSQHEARAFEIHLREACAVCSEELSRHEGVIGNLGLAAPSYTPSPYLHELLLARIEREAQPQIMVTPSKEAPAEPAPAPQRPSVTRTLLPWVIAASFAVVAFLSWLSLRQIREEIAAQQGRLDAVVSETEQLKTKLDQERVRAQDLEQIRSILASPGSRVIILEGQAPAPSASAAIIWDTQNNRWMVTAHLPPPPAGKVYQLWFVTPEARISAGLIRTDPTGSSLTFIDVPSSLKRIAATAITLEPEGGSQQPTMPIYALGRVG